MFQAKNALVALLFAAFAFAGWSTLPDYGASCDELAQHALAVRTVRLVSQTDLTLLSQFQLHHGPFFTLILYGIEKALGLTDFSQIFPMRHICTFALFFVSLFFFYRLALRHFKNFPAAVAAGIFLALSPRIFSDSFHNVKDIPFLSLFVIQSWAMLRFLDAPSFRRATLFGVLSAASMAVRVLGALPVCFALLYLGSGALRLEWAGLQREAFKRSAYAVVAAGVFALVLPLFWPAMWSHSNPIEFMFAAFKKMSLYPLYLENFYLGAWHDNKALPWHYIPVWIAVTTPLSVLFLAVAGVIASVTDFRKSDAAKRRNLLFFAVWIALPIGAAIARHSVLYDGWRHFFFVYPAIVLFGVAGLVAVIGWIRTRLSGKARTLGMAIVLLLIALDFGQVIGFMIRNHPYQNVYFNALTGGIRGAISRFELDYWGLSHRQALEWILANDSRPLIRVAMERGGHSALSIFDPASRRRFKRTSAQEADYFIGNGRTLADPVQRNIPALHTIRVDGTPISIIWKQKES